MELGPSDIGTITTHHSPGIGRIETFYVEPVNQQTIYLGSRSGGFWKTTDGGITWMNTTDGLIAAGVNTIAVSPTNPDSILINVKNSRNDYTQGIYRSIDGGNTWILSNFTPANTGLGGFNSTAKVRVIAIHPRIPDLIFIGTNKGLYRSNDQLASWQEVIETGDFDDIAFHPTDDSVIYIHDSDNKNKVFFSLDTGGTFSSSPEITGNNGVRAWIDVSDAAPNSVWFGSKNGLWRANNITLNFTLLGVPTENVREMSVSDVDPNIVILGYLDLLRTTDNGATFEQITNWNYNASETNFDTNYVHADLRASNFINGTFYVGTDGYLAKSDDNGVNWEKINAGTAVRENYNLGVSQSKKDYVSCGSQDNGTSVLTDNGWVEWIGADGMETIIHPLNGDYILGSTQNAGRKRSLTGPDNLMSISPPDQNASWVAPMEFDPLDHMRIYSLGEKIYRSDDFGGNWETLAEPGIGEIQIFAIAEGNSDKMMLSKNSTLLRSIDGGATVQDITGTLPNHNITDIKFDPKDEHTVVVTYGQVWDNNKRIYISHDGGDTWENISFNLSEMPVYSIAIDYQKNIYVGAEIGVYSMPMNGSEWVLFSENMPYVACSDLEIQHGTNTLYTASWGRGLWSRCLHGRDGFPSIDEVTTSDQISLIQPTTQAMPFISAVISYSGTLSNVFIKWSNGDNSLGQQINMSQTNGTTWETDSGIPKFQEGENVYFKVFAVGSNNDTTETFPFQYTVRPFDYCEAMGAPNTSADYINEVHLNGMVNLSGKDAYGDFSDTLVTLQKGMVYELLVGMHYSFSADTVYAWFDWNNNAEFSNEDELFLFTQLNGDHEATSQITVPENAISDTIRMRVRSMYWNSAPDPCGSVTGEVEDYSILIEDACITHAMVTNTLDSGDGSLRSLINQVCPDDTLFFDAALMGDTIALSGSEILIDRNLCIVGLGTDHITLNAQSNSRHFQIDQEAIVCIKNLTLINGFNNVEGGSILNHGVLYLQDLIFENNTGGNEIRAILNKGALHIETGTVEIKK